jgi:2-iminobutanoate/2-iminopropanoate deaminase
MSSSDAQPSRQAITTHEAPSAIGPYSQAVRAGAFLFISGQIGLVPSTGVVAEGGIAGETHQVLRNLDAILRAAGVSLASVVKTTVYMADLGEFEAMNRVYATYFPRPEPARSTIQAARLPRDARVEIDVIAAL